MPEDSTIDLGRSGDETRAWNSREEEAKHYARAFVGDTLGGFRIVREIGHGSMGIVFLGNHIDDARVAAIKILPPSLSVTTTVIKRFLREAESVKKLDHEGIVKIFSVGEENGIHFYAMQFVEGASLDRVLRQRRFSVRECATIVGESARALFFAHEAEIIHRDIKPANIILTHKDRPILTDFGLAKPEKAATLTESGALVGTPIYMSPEQVRADKTQIDRRTDIYSLGITFYEMLTGVTPFEGQSTQEILGKIENTDPAPLRKVRPDVPRAIEIICQKAIEKEQGRRYQTAIELALDLERFLRGEPIQARPPSTTSRIVRKLKKHPTVAGLSFALVLAFGILLIQGVLNRGSREAVKEAQADAIESQYLKKLAESANDFETSGPSIAIVGYSEAIGIIPGRPDAFIERGRCYFNMQSYEKAIADFDSALAVEPGSLRAKLWRGISKCQDGTRTQQDAGIDDLKDTLQFLDTDPECLYHASLFCLQLAQSAGSPIARDKFINAVDQRLQHLEETIARNEAQALAEGRKPNFRVSKDQILVLQGQLYDEQGLIEEARTMYRKALEIQPKNPLARSLLGERPKSASSSGASPNAAGPAGVSGWFAVLATEGLAWANRRLEADPAFLRRAADAMNVYRDNPVAGTNLKLPEHETPDTLDRQLLEAEQKWQLGDEKGAVAIYEHVLIYMPTVEACCRLAEHYRKQPDRSEDAIRYAEAALKINPTNPYALAVAVKVYSKAGNGKRVLELAQQIKAVHAVLLSTPDVQAALQPFDKDGTLTPGTTPPPSGDGN